MRLLPVIATAAACALLAPTARAGAGAGATESADASGSRKARAEVFFKDGIEAYRHHRYKDAIDAFLQAHRIYPSPSLSYNTARAYEKLHDSAGALRFYRAYLRQSPDASDRKHVERRIKKLEVKLHSKGVQQVTVMSEPDAATVIIDGRPVGVTPWTGEITPGRHRLRLQLDGYQETKRDFELPDLTAIDVNATLLPAPPKPVAAPAAPATQPTPGGAPPRDEHPHHGVRMPTWIAFGAGAAALGGAAVFEGLRRSSENSVKTEPTQVARASAYDQMKSRQTTARILAAAGGAALVIGGVLLYVDLSTSENEKSARLTLACAPGRCDAGFGGRW